MISIWKEALKLLQEEQDFCVATIISLQGSSPRHVGAKFLVKRDGSSVGTIGGGVFEAEVIIKAVEALRERSSVLLKFAFTGNDASSQEMLCGGSAQVLIEYNSVHDPFRKSIYENLIRLDSQGLCGFLLTQIPDENDLMDSRLMKSLLYDETGLFLGELAKQSMTIGEIKSKKFSGSPELVRIDHLNFDAFVEHFHPSGSVFIFGAGHVGICVAHLASYAGFRVVLIDDRKEFASDRKVPEADEIIVVSSFDECFSELNVGIDSYIVIVTRGHSHDKVVLAQALKTAARYIGMIGSKRKIKLIFERLLYEGISNSQLQRVHAPIGLPIGGETPEEIAVSIVAELIQVKQASSANPKRSVCMSL